MKKKDIVFWWVVVLVGLFIVYKILEFNWRCTEEARKYQAEVRNEMRKQGHNVSHGGVMVNKTVEVGN